MKRSFTVTTDDEGFYEILSDYRDMGYRSKTEFLVHALYHARDLTRSEQIPLEFLELLESESFQTRVTELVLGVLDSSDAKKKIASIVEDVSGFRPFR